MAGLGAGDLLVTEVSAGEPQEQTETQNIKEEGSRDPRLAPSKRSQLRSKGTRRIDFSTPGYEGTGIRNSEDNLHAPTEKIKIQSLARR